MARQVVETKAKSFDHEILQVLIVYGEGIDKRDIKCENHLTKRHRIPYKSNTGYEIKGLIGS